MKSVAVSDHAIVRWLERKYGIDVGEIRREIAGIVGHAARAGATSYSASGLTFAMSHNPDAIVVTTIIAADSPSAAVTDAVLARGEYLTRRGHDRRRERRGAEE